MEIDWMFDWAEIIALVFLVIGLLLSLLSSSNVILYVVCFLAGLMFGRIWWKWKGVSKVPVFLWVAGFTLGFLLAALYANLRLIFILIVLGAVVGYHVHEKKLIKT